MVVVAGPALKRYGVRMPVDRIEPIQRALLRWYEAHQRDLPWRRSSDPYAIWVSEVMLQQTQVATVKPYYERFLEQFPTVEALAAAPLDDVLKAWEGLGYYGRARNLHRAAKHVVAEHDGKLPDRVDELLKLPGVGKYTAGALASIAFGLDEPVLDGNVTRVLARVFRVRGDVTKAGTQKALWALARDLIPSGEASFFNQALMDLGAQICVPRAPRCLACPLYDPCEARAHDEQALLPVKAKRKPVPHHQGAVALVWKDGKLLLGQRPAQGLLGGLWEFPGGKLEENETPAACAAREAREELGIEVRVRRFLTTVQHAYTHFRVTLHAFECDLLSGEPQALGCDDWAWASPGELDRYAFPKATHKVLAALREVGRV